jgi:hypothetical protein
MLPRVRGWLLAAVDGNTGLVPANYIQILGRSEGKPVPRPDLVSHEEPMVGEFLQA